MQTTENSKKMQQQKQFQEQADNIQNQQLQQEEFIQQEDQYSQNSSQQESEQQLRQKPAFMLIPEQKLSKQNQQIKKTNFISEDVENQSQQFNQQQKNAFLYLLHVRKQKKMLKRQKINKKQQIEKQILVSESFNIQIDEQYQITKQPLLKQPTNLKPNSQPEFNIKNSIPNNDHLQNQLSKSPYQSINHHHKIHLSQIILQNFQTVIKNIKYLIKNDPSYQNNNKRFNIKLYESIRLDKTPTIYELMKLTLGEIQDAMRKISNQMLYGAKQQKGKKNSNKQCVKQQFNQKEKEKREQKLDKIQVQLQNRNQIQPFMELNDKQNTHQTAKIQENKDNSENQTPRIYNFCLWTYSLLCLHQSWSSYIHFQSLAQINSILIRQIQNIQKQNINIKNNKQNQQLLVIVVLMIKVFQQRHLERFLQRLV